MEWRHGYDDVRITNVTRQWDNLEEGISVYGYPISASAPAYAHSNVYVGYSLAYNNFGDPKSGAPSGNGHRAWRREERHHRALSGA